MEERIEQLLDKYWEGESSLEEERELRQLLSKAQGYEQERAFFGELTSLQDQELPTIKNPASRPGGVQWLKMAAVFAVFMALTALVFQFQKHQAQQERQQEAMAYAQVMEAFALINENMNKGTRELEVMEEFRYLGTPMELFEE